MSKKIFVSYSIEDVSKVLQVKREIESDGHRIWMYPRAIEPGDHIVESERKGIEDSDFVIIMLSENSIKSKAVLEEIEITKSVQSQSGKRKLIYIRIDDKIPLRNDEGIQISDLSNHRSYPIELHKLLKKIEYHRNYYLVQKVTRYITHEGWYKVTLELDGILTNVIEVDYHLHPDIVLDKNTVDRSTSYNKKFSISFETNTPEYIYAIVRLNDGTIEELRHFVKLN
jgi:hypothetical protein